MSDFNFVDFQYGLPHEAQLALESADYAAQQEFLLDAMLLDDQSPTDRPPELPDNDVQPDVSSGDKEPLDDEPSVEQPFELPSEGSVQQGLKVLTFHGFVPITNQPSAGQPSQLQACSAQDETMSDRSNFERDMAHFLSDPQGWLDQHDESIRSDGFVNFGDLPNNPGFDFEYDSEMDDVFRSTDFTTQAPAAGPVNSLVLGGGTEMISTTTTTGPHQQVFEQPGVVQSHFPKTPASHPLPYRFDWDEIARRQSDVMGGNRSGQLITNSGTGTQLESIPEHDALLPGLYYTPPEQTFSFDNMDTAVRTLTTPSPSPTLQAASVKKQPAERRQTIATGRNQLAVKFPIYNDSLLVNDLTEAKETVNTRIPLDILDDDREAVFSCPQIWIPLIAKAFESDFLEQPDEGPRLTPEGQAEWTRWQSEHQNKVWSILQSRPDASRFVQSCAWIFYQLVLDSHEMGKGLPHVGKTIANPGPNVTLKCSERITNAITVLEKFPIVRYDFLKQDRLDGLAANPVGFVNRKIENMWVNYKKKPNTGAVKEEVVKNELASSGGADFNAKKRKAGLLSQQCSADDYTMSDLDNDTQPQRKKAKATSKKRRSHSMVASSGVARPMEVKEEDMIL
jgi:hypothetical protein